MGSETGEMKRREGGTRYRDSAAYSVLLNIFHFRGVGGMKRFYCYYHLFRWI